MRILKSVLQVKPTEVDTFLKGGGALDINSVRKKPKVQLLTSQQQVAVHLWARALFTNSIAFPHVLPHPCIRLHKDSLISLQEWIPDSAWLNIVALGSIDALRNITDSVVKGEAAWRAWYDQEAPEQAPMPEYETRLTKFERMCVVKVNPCPVVVLDTSLTLCQALS